MSNKPPSRGSHNSMRNNDTSQTEEHHFRYVDPAERWRQEYERHNSAEEKLTKLSKLNYEPFEYAPMLVKVPWKERQVPDFSFLIEDAKQAAESKYFIPVAVRLAGFFLSILILIYSTSTMFLWAAGTVSITLLINLFLIIQQRHKAVEVAVTQARFDVETRTEQERELIENARLQHETSEQERIALIEKLLQGDVPTIFLRLDTVLTKLDLPFPIAVDIDIYSSIPLVQVWLPSKAIIPTQVCALLTSGRVKYTDKETRTIHKQYIEACSAVIMQVVSTIYANIPTVDRLYIWGMLKNIPENECLFDIVANRENIVNACKAENGISAINQLNCKLETDTMLNLKPLHQEQPEEWGKVPSQLIRSLNIKIFSNK
ncbi:hypothetical protein [Dendrosporobacter sp. 1207_IL3150]|uniref:hypothetical protein n=1 Tax=Dendrosporobacter sp. 1207_IL3150 TaxID=3084054 RepID=UPI002FDA695E